MSAVRIKYVLLGLAMVFLVLFLMEIDPELCYEQLSRVGLGMIPILTVSFLAYLFATWAWQLCYYAGFRGALFKKVRIFFAIRQIGESLATINPTGIVAGDALKYMLMKSHAMDRKKSLLSLSLLRVLTIVSFVFLLLAGIIVSYSSLLAATNIIWMWLALIVFILMAYVLTRLMFSSKLWIYRLSVRLSSFLRFNFKRQAGYLEKIESINKSTAQAGSFPKEIILVALFLLLIHWFMGALEFALILHYLGHSISLVDAFTLEVGTSFARSIMSFIPGQIGVEEYANKLFLDMIGVKAEGIWIAVSIIRRLRQLFWIAIGLLLYLKNYRKVDFSWESPPIVNNGGLVHQS